MKPSYQEIIDTHKGIYSIDVYANQSQEDPSLKWWDWEVYFKPTRGFGDDIASGVSFASQDQARACAKAIIRVLGKKP